MKNIRLQLNNLGEVAQFQYDENSNEIGERLSDYEYINKIHKGILESYGSIDINIGGLLNLIGILTKDELRYLIAISNLFLYTEYVFYIGRRFNYKSDNRLMYSCSDDKLESIADIEFVANYLNIQTSDCSSFIQRLINVNIINIKYIKDKSNKAIYLFNPRVFNCDGMGNYPYLLYDNKEDYLSLNDIFYGEYIENCVEKEISFKISTEQGTRETKEYRDWKQSVLERDNYTCQCCESTLNPDVHHILNYAQYKDLRTDVDNGVVLCQCCHSPMIKGSFHNTNGTRNNTKEQLQSYINTRRSELGLQPKTI